MKDTTIEVREDFILSPAGDSHPQLRTAHFLKPISNSIDEPSFKLNPFSSSFSVFEPKELPLKINFIGWRLTQKKWVSWVHKLKQNYESVWKKDGIFDAIMTTKCYIHKNQYLLYGVVEKWCSKTNTFVFSFGEATITLEDIMVLGRYPVLDDPVFTSLQDQEMKEIEEKLIIARQQLTNRKHGGVANTSCWMDIFIDKGSKIEPEAFLATWLSLFVFPHKNYLVKSSFFPIAVHLARGNPIALGPAVLASIYKDLTLFKKTIVDLSKLSVGSDRYPLEVTLESPFYLVQIWVWERFGNLGVALDSAMDDFLWRPYARYAHKYGMFYPNDGIWVLF